MIDFFKKMNSWTDYYRSAVSNEYMPPQNRLFAPERPVIDYNVIADSEPYTSSALRGGKKLRKGSAEAKRYMAYLRSLRSPGKRRGGKYMGIPDEINFPYRRVDIEEILRHQGRQNRRKQVLQDIARERQIREHIKNLYPTRIGGPGGVYHPPESGSGVLGDLLGMAGKRAAEWVGDMVNTSRELKYLQELKKQKGGDWKSDLKDVL